MFIANKIFNGIDNKDDLIRSAIHKNSNATPAQFKEWCIETALEQYVIDENTSMALNIN